MTVVAEAMEDATPLAVLDFEEGVGAAEECVETMEAVVVEEVSIKAVVVAMIAVGFVDAETAEATAEGGAEVEAVDRRQLSLKHSRECSRCAASFLGD